MNYKEKLKDPRWQKKRLEILERDNWACKWCGNTEIELHVHHLEYNKNPWDVLDENMITLCKNCHDKYHWYWEDALHDIHLIIRQNPEFIKILHWFVDNYYSAIEKETTDKGIRPVEMICNMLYPALLEGGKSNEDIGLLSHIIQDNKYIRKYKDYLGIDTD